MKTKLLRSLAIACLGAGLGAWGGCASPPEWERANAQRLEAAESEGLNAIAPERKARRWTGGVTAVASDRPGIPNMGLQLPRVSPDGRWIAFLDADSESPRVLPDALVSGRGLGGVSLWVRGVEEEGLAQNVAVAHAAWPAWSSDASTLVFISHDPRTGCALGLHEVATGQTDRLAVGLRKMLTPAVSPDNQRVAVSGYGQIADQALLFIIDRDSGETTPGPQPTLGGAQLMPHWLDRETLIFVELDDNGGGLMRWTVGSPQAEPIAPLQLPESVFDAIHLHAGVPSPVSADGRYFTYYAVGSDQMIWIDMDTGDALALNPGDRAGTWWNEQWFLVANDQQLELTAAPQPLGATGEPSAEQEPEQERPRMNLLPGRWVPLWADATQQSMLLVGQSDRPDRFRLLQLWVITQ
ncbi:PD40 domain-containing protein [Algisphaera agarilytica]|uniref:WD40-like Beta Propeller Repeat n=1 Tax=Algisphaera agarilytica TaxID=1385975 RepID=A0A7X0LLF0_9BACT|nr:PD40 domain-containing protein [Algisphaera agarilytica]MBB6429903.1 hypothetical protein [Algisphaera agarilytica]